MLVPAICHKCATNIMTCFRSQFLEKIVKSGYYGSVWIELIVVETENTVAK